MLFTTFALLGKTKQTPCNITIITYSYSFYTISNFSTSFVHEDIQNCEGIPAEVLLGYLHITILLFVWKAAVNEGHLQHTYVDLIYKIHT